MRMSKKTKKINLISKMISKLLIFMTLIFFGFIVLVNILPIKYLLILLLTLTIAVCIILFFLSNKKVSKRIMIILDAVSVVLILIMTVGLIYGLKTMGFLSDLSSKSYKTENYYLIVLDNDKYNELEDLENKTIGVYENNSEGLTKALSDINNKIDNEETSYTNLASLAEDLLCDHIDAILIEDSYKSILEEENVEFKDNTKSIYNITVKIRIESISKEINVAEDPFNVYISGIDTYGTVDSVSRSDVNIVVTINPNTSKILLTTIPRDYYVQLHGTTGTKDKFTHAGIYGIDMSVETVEDLLDIDINYYVKINFTSLIKIVDTIGGIDAYSKYTFTSKDKYRFVEGYNYMNGLQALSFSRTRKTLPGGDRTRGENQQAVIEAIIKKVSTPAIITKYNSILTSLAGSFQTNMSTSKMFEFVKIQLDENPTWTVKSISLNGSDSSNYTYTYGTQKLYVMEPDISTINIAKEEIATITKGD